MIDLLEKNIELNSIEGSWHFKEGMGFGEENLWWGDKKKRIVPHEGIDLGYIKNKSSNGTMISNIPPEFKVHNFFEGEVIKIISDFIGQSVFIKHSKTCLNKKELFSIFGHVESGLKKGSIYPFDLIGKTAVKKNVPEHYHYSMVLIPVNTDIERLDWRYINSIEGVEFINPLKHKYRDVG